MASISSQLQLADGMSPTLRKINNALLTCLDSFEAMQGASSNAIDTESIRMARSQLADVNTELEKMTTSVQNVSSDLEKSVHHADDMLGKIAKMAAGYLSVRSAVNFAKDAIESAFKDQSINTQLAVSLRNTGLDMDAYNQIQGTAKNYGMYAQTAMVAAGAEFATYMSDVNAIESMMGTLADYATGMAVTEGLDLSTVDIANYATQLGKVINGKFDGISLKGFEVTDTQKEILSIGTDMEKAAVVADIINESWANMYTCMASTPEGQLNTLLNTIDRMKTEMGMSLLPVFLQLVQTVQDNLPTIQQLIIGAGNAANAIIPILTVIASGALSMVRFFVDNWSGIAPIVWGIVAAYSAWKIITLAQAVAQRVLKLELLANPLTWIVLLIGAVIAVIYKWIQSVGGLTNAWNICKAALLVAWNAIKVGWYATVYGVTWGINKVMDFVDLLKLCWQKAGVSIANFMGDMKVSVLMILQNMINSAIDIINGFVGVLNKIPGVNIGLIEQVTFATTAAAENEAARQARAENLAAYEADLAVGKAEREANLANAKANLDSATAELSASASEVAALYAASRDAATAFAEEASLTDSIANILAGSDGMSAIAENTSYLKDTTEDLKYLRDIAEQEAVNRFTTAEVKIDMTGMTNRIDSDVDLDGLLTVLTDGFAEALEIAAEGVHA